jgi:hypothetical protein
LHPFSQFQSTITSGRQSKTLFFKVEFSHDIGIKKVGRDAAYLACLLGGKYPFKRDDFSYCFFSKVVTKVIYYLQKENQ